MQSNIQQAYLIRDEKNAGANTATRIGTLLAALCADVAQHDTSITELGNGITALTPATVDISDGFTALNPIYGSGKAGIYQLVFGGANAGWMVVGGDGTIMMTTQTVIGKFAVTDGTLGFASSGKSTVLTRYMNTMVGDEQQLGWTEWQDLGAVPDTSPYVLPAALKQSSWNQSDLPDKQELVKAWQAGRPIRTSTGCTVEMQVEDTQVAVVFKVHWPNFVVGTATYRGTATTWGYDALPWQLYQIPATAATAEALDAQSSDQH